MEAPDVLPDMVVKPELAGFTKLHDAGGGEALRV
jgi:hypothetical protein